MKYTINKKRERESYFTFYTTITASIIKLIEDEFQLEGPSEKWADYKNGKVSSLIVKFPDEIVPDTIVKIDCVKQFTNLRKVYISKSDLPLDKKLINVDVWIKIAKWLGACNSILDMVKGAVNNDYDLEKFLEDKGEIQNELYYRL